MNKEIKIGVFGARRGTSFYRPINRTEGFRVTAICDTSADKIAHAKKVLNDDNLLFFETWEEMIASGIDAVILANYFHEHASYAIKAMEMGIDVISETTAAPTPGECLDLIECCERTGRKYLLAANAPSLIGAKELERIYKSGELGEVLYGEAEYVHPLTLDEKEDIIPTTDHWRNFIPTTYYNMHSLGVLIAATGLTPKRVTALEICPETEDEIAVTMANKARAGIALYQMDNGSVFRSTGCCRFGPSGNWYRLSCEKGTVETLRQNQDRVLLRKNWKGVTEYDPETQYSADEKKFGHGGADAGVCRLICDYLSGKISEPPFDIYRAVTLSLAGIYGLYSILDGKTYDIPDVKNKEERECLRGDYRSPFPDKDGKITLPFGTSYDKYAK